MSRPFSWICRLADIRRSVSNSQRSHYGRRDLELLFKVSAASAGRLLELIATDPLNNSRLVARDKLQTFLEAVSEADDVPALCKSIQARREHLTRVKARYLCVRDEAEVTLASLPPTIVLNSKYLLILHEGPEDLFRQLVLLSQAADDDAIALERAAESPRQVELSAEARDARWILAENARMDGLIAHRSGGSSGGTASGTSMPLHRSP